MRTYRPTKRRIYPLRTSSLQWKITLYSKHQCSDTCKLSYVTHDDVMIIIDNPDYNQVDKKCSYHNTINPSIVQISEFDKSRPRTMDGELLYDLQIVIPDTEIYINIDFPVTHSKKIKVVSSNPLGFSLSNLIQSVKDAYEMVYSYEEQTATECQFLIEQRCLCNTETPLYRPVQITETCPICLDQDNHKPLGQTLCDHVFHTECLDTWASNGKETCPLCRKALRNCETCNGTKLKKTYYNGKVLPKELRGSSCRNHTDGIFGIYGYDIDQLYIEDMVYNRVTKTLTLQLFG
jgi:Ring finger domain